MVCEGCGTQLNPKLQTVFQAAHGWIKLSKAGAPASTLFRRDELPRFRCKGCIHGSESDDSPWKQGSLF
jgi:hypothetical protein